MYAGQIPAVETTVSSLAIDPQMQSVPDECDTFWKLEKMGIIDSNDSTDVDKIVQEKFQSTIQFKDNRYYVSWPFKSDNVNLPSNAGLAIARLRSTLRKLNQDPDLIKQYQVIIDDQLKRGTIEIAPRIPQGKIVHYLPHHAVLTPQKTTTKVRMVFDGSAKASKGNQSLNDCLHRGPINMPEIPGLLFRIRSAKIVLTGDIEKAFHQVYLNDIDRDSVRFFWVKDTSQPAEGDNLIALRFKLLQLGMAPGRVNPEIPGPGPARYRAGAGRGFFSPGRVGPGMKNYARWFVI
uniref:Uncharacterized protein n=1 Tax=Panagrolaimus davidi TaxID=227884 RepID=A0A914Q4V3_9BILA